MASRAEPGDGTQVEKLILMRRILFFYKQKRAYEIQGDWSSDVCSSDLLALQPPDRIKIPPSGGPPPCPLLARSPSWSRCPSPRLPWQRAPSPSKRRW